MNPKQGTVIITDQVRELLNLIDNKIYCQPLTAFSGSSIGQHIRHVIDFYLCLNRGCGCGNIDYDTRQRNPMIEKDTDVAITELEEISDCIQTLDIYKVVYVNSSFTDDESEANSQIPSSIGRELMYAYDHALHHLAMVKIGMKQHFPKIVINNNLGVAPSTLKYRKVAKAVSLN
jgi:hypothetical protein